MLLVSVVTTEKQNSSWQTWAVGDATPYGVGKRPLVQQTCLAWAAVGGSSWRDQHRDLKLAETEQDIVRNMKAQTVSQIAHQNAHQSAQQQVQQTQWLCYPELQNLNLQNDQ